MRFEAQIGTRPRFLAEVFQPLDYASRWFVGASFEHGWDIEYLFDDGRRLAQFRSEQSRIDLSGGRQFGNWGEIRLALSEIRTDGSPLVGGIVPDAVKTKIRAPTLSFLYDTLDDNSIPRFGALTGLNWLASRESLGSDGEFDLTQLTVLKPVTWGKNTLLNWWDFGGATRGEIRPFALGGLFDLSGYAEAEIAGKHLVIGRLLYYRQLGENNLPAFDTSVYVGGSIELGNTWNSGSDISFDSALSAGSLFVVLDTLIGPIYLAYGRAEGGRSSAYLFVGQTF